MDFELVFKELLEKFNKQNIRFALIGGFALHVAGFSRATKDIDFLVESEDLDKVENIMFQLGYERIHKSLEFSNYWHPVGPLGCVDYLHAHRQYTKKMILRAKKHQVLEKFKIPVLIPEDIIGLKVQAFVNNPDRYLLDMTDIKYLLKENFKKIDMNIIEEYFDLFDQRTKLNELLKEIQNVE